MKRILGLLTMLVSLQVFAGTMANDVQDDKPVNIKLDKGKATDEDTHPRTLIPITCVYVDGTIQLSLYGGVGEFTLTVINQTTGECWSAENTLVLSTSSTSGVYLVQIVTKDGDMYWGTYTL